MRMLSGRRQRLDLLLTKKSFGMIAQPLRVAQILPPWSAAKRPAGFRLVDREAQMLAEWQAQLAWRVAVLQPRVVAVWLTVRVCVRVRVLEVVAVVREATREAVREAVRVVVA